LEPHSPADAQKYAFAGLLRFCLWLVADGSLGGLVCWGSIVFRTSVLALTGICFAVFAAVAAYAMAITPIVLDLEELGGRSSGSIAVTNPNAAPLPVELKIRRIEIDERGDIISKTDAIEDFLVLPPQAIIPPGGTQNFRIQYIGPDGLDKSRIYQFLVDQVPVAPKDDGNAQIQIVYSITGLITLAPLEAVSDISVVGGAIETDGKGKHFAAVRLRNAGNRHAYLSRGNLTVRQVDAAGVTIWRESLSSARLEKEVGFGVLAPQQERVFRLPYPLERADGTIEAEYNTRDQK